MQILLIDVFLQLQYCTDREKIIYQQRQELLLLTVSKNTQTIKKNSKYFYLYNKSENFGFNIPGMKKLH